jgi:hypothetical protein
LRELMTSSVIATSCTILIISTLATAFCISLRLLLPQNNGGNTRKHENL